MEDPPVRPEVVKALIAAHDSAVPWDALATADLEYTPPPTAAERAEARRTVRERNLSD